MSDHWICIIPREPAFVPSEQAIAAAADFMAEIAPDSEEISSELADAVRFRDCGGNFESIRCPVCNADVPIEWWAEQMGDEDCWYDGIDLKPLRLPCGDMVKSLNELRYYYDQGFSRFILDAMNPYIGELEPEQTTRFEEILGCPVKVIYQHI